MLFQTSILFLLSLLPSIVVVQAQSCSASNPCKTGCCSKFGFCGLGPDYCAPKICVANCDRKAECDPGGYGAAYVNHTTCPLNVCCSKWGFCGLTQEFCGNKKVTQPSCSTSFHKFERVVGYYEGWAMQRKCNIFNPEKIPLGVYTHLNYAFATIDPKTFEVLPASIEDQQDTYDRVTWLKKRDPDLKVFIAIGGWTFNDEGQPTRNTFSNIANNPSNQKAFIKSLISFLSTYNFDGVDLDWEYPEAPDRGGIGADYDNFPKFLSNLKSSLKATGGRDGLSVTLPASYWYLQHFDIKKLAKIVDFFNVMSYDLHGVWDMPNKWVGPYLNAHTNLTEIKDALDLLWRNNIPYDKVNMGLAFYGRGFTAADPKCLTPGCRYASGSKSRACSHEVGIVFNSEISDIMQSQNVQPVLYKDAAVKVLTYDTNQWVAFDDEETLGLKLNFAKSKCLGGVMVWAVSHDTENATYSNALGKLAQRSTTSLINIGIDNGVPQYERVQNHPQCKWSNCGEECLLTSRPQGCPAGWSPIQRSDPDARNGEIMIDDQGCEGQGSHYLCCPVEEGLPTCGWYGFNNGDCSPFCPTDYVEIGSNNMYCRKGGHSRILQKSYQAACCSKTVGVGPHRVSFESLKLAGQCAWGNYPQCDTQCSGGTSLMVASYGGTGGAFCWSGGTKFQNRPYCCNEPDQDWQYTDCQWYRDIGNGPSGDRDCKSGCPSDTVRVAMGWDRTIDSCRVGEQAYCCKTTSRSIYQRSDPNVERYTTALKSYLADPTCPADDIAKLKLKRQVNNTEGITWDIVPSGLGLSRRTTITEEVVGDMEDLITEIMESSSSSVGVQDLWESLVVPLFPALTITNIRAWFEGDIPLLRGARGDHLLGIFILCGLGFRAWNNEIVAATLGGGLGTIVCSTPTQTNYCQFDPDDPDHQPLRKRTRTSNYDWSTTLGQTTYGGHLVSQPYRTSNEWSILNDRTIEIYGQVYLFPGPGCTNFVLRVENRVAERRNGPLERTVTEHHVELQTVKMWYEAAIQGVLATERNVAAAPNPAGRIDPTFFTVTLVHANGPYLFNPLPPPPTGGQLLSTLQDRLFNALGSVANDGNFVIADEGLNCIKEKLWDDRTENFIDRSVMIATSSTTDPDDAQIALNNVRNVVAIMSFLNHPVIHSNMASIIMDFRRELKLAARIHLQLTGVTVPAVESFTNYYRSLMTRTGTRVRTFAAQWLDAIDATWANVNTPAGANVRAISAAIRTVAQSAAVNTQGFFDPV
ncbi:chitin-binding, type 1 [Trichoderma arundinaceum]|uniref:chitinase n=1 Tax=Trichoderma arundinaceum TaxID=490622 RepID=A0A395P0Y1_TRIAR|nr:chitin-binding, type 1 [Trichoderma arundinaceum]